VKRGVDVYSVENLHAKVFVIGKTAIVGSTNVSSSSARRLIEAALQTEDKRAVSACRHFILSLRGEIATPQYLKKLQKLYRPPKFGVGGGALRGLHKQVPRHAPLWVVPLEHCESDVEDDEAMKRGVAKAKPMLRSKRFTIDDFIWSGTGFVNRLNEGEDLILEITREDRQRFMVSEPAPLLHIERYKKNRAIHANLTVELPRKTCRIEAHRLFRRLGPNSKSIRKTGSPKKITDPVLIHDLLNLWAEGPSSSSSRR
jgi:hypothetical protein